MKLRAAGAPTVSLGLAVLAGCWSSTPLEEAAELTAAGSLPRALAVLDHIPPGAQDYAEARILAEALERRIRIAQRLVQEGLDLRAERRDEAARRCFAGARAIWPEVSAARDLLVATEARIAALSAPPLADGKTGDVRRTRTVLPWFDGVRPAPAGETDLRDESGRDLVERAQRLLQEGRVDVALDLLEKHRGVAADANVDRLWRRALRNRALVAYSRGDLQAAAQAWRGVLDLDPTDGLAHTYLAAIRAELGRREP